jgi:hypothetical protein
VPASLTMSSSSAAPRAPATAVACPSRDGARRAPPAADGAAAAAADLGVDSEGLSDSGVPGVHSRCCSCEHEKRAPSGLLLQWRMEKGARLCRRAPEGQTELTAVEGEGAFF